MKSFLLVIVILGGAVAACAQSKQNSLSVGVDLAVPVYTMVGDMEGALTGLFVKKEWRGRSGLAATASIGYNHFNGTIKAFDDKETKDFAVIPLLAGLKYYAWHHYYAGLEAGLSIKAHKNAATKLTLVPAIGMLVPVAGKQIDLGLRFYTVPSGASTPEASILNRGGYSFLGARIALVF